MRYAPGSVTATLQHVQDFLTAHADKLGVLAPSGAAKKIDEIAASLDGHGVPADLALRPRQRVGLPDGQISGGRRWRQRCYGDVPVLLVQITIVPQLAPVPPYSGEGRVSLDGARNECRLWNRRAAEPSASGS